MKKLLLAVMWAVGLAGCVAAPKHTIDPAERQIQGGRELVVTVPQGEIKGDIEVATAGTSFGLVGALIDAGINQSRASSSEDAIRPLRDALVDYDFDGKALNTAKAALEAVPWLSIGKVSFLKETSDDRLTEELDAASTPQVVHVAYGYSLRPGFSTLQVAWTVSILSKTPPAGGKPKDRLKPSNFVFNRDFLCVQTLANPAKEQESNAKLWAADQAQLARAAIEDCFAHFVAITQRGLEIEAGPVDAITKNEQVEQSGFSGNLIERMTDGILLQDYTERWVFIRNVQNNVMN